MQKNRKSNKPLVSVIQLDMNNNFIAEHISMSEAANKTNSNISKICLVCQNKRKSHNNYKWKYNEK